MIFLKSFAECLTRFWYFSFLKIIFRHWIWNDIPDLEQNCCFKIVFCLLFQNGLLEPVAIFLALVALKIFFGAFLFENCFLTLIAAKMIFCACRLENDFLLLLLWKLFLAPVALKNVCRLPLWKFFVLVNVCR